MIIIIPFSATMTTEASDDWWSYERFLRVVCRCSGDRTNGDHSDWSVSREADGSLVQLGCLLLHRLSQVTLVFQRMKTAQKAAHYTPVHFQAPLLNKCLPLLKDGKLLFPILFKFVHFSLHPRRWRTGSLLPHRSEAVRNSSKTHCHVPPHGNL